MHSKVVSILRNILKHLPKRKYTLHGRFDRCLHASAASSGYAVIPTHKERHIMKQHERGLLSDVFPPQDPYVHDVLAQPGQHVYCGYDLTADSLHIGHLLTIKLMLHCQRAQHQPICLLGGATSVVGDPTGRRKERPLLSADELATNMTGIRGDLRRVFRNHEEFLWGERPGQGQGAAAHRTLREPLFLNNLDWYNDMTLLHFLTYIGRNARIGPMLSRESVKNRLALDEGGMSLTEFTYQVIQAYDFYHLHNEYGCLIQIGGRDQLGNMMSGHDLIDRLKQTTVYGLCVPLITNECGQKLGKSTGNVLWLNKKKTPAFNLYQYFLGIQDSDVERYLKLFTFFTDSQIASLMEQHWERPESWKAQKALAEQVTLLVHGERGVRDAELCTRALFQEDITALSEVGASVEELQLCLPGATIHKLLLEPGLTVIDLAMTLKAFQDIHVADRIIKAGGFYINHIRQSQPDYLVQINEHILPNMISLVRVGKRHYHIVKWLQ